MMIIIIVCYCFNHGCIGFMKSLLRKETDAVMAELVWGLGLVMELPCPEEGCSSLPGRFIRGLGRAGSDYWDRTHQEGFISFWRPWAPASGIHREHTAFVRLCFSFSFASASHRGWRKGTPVPPLPRLGGSDSWESLFVFLRCSCLVVVASPREKEATAPGTCFAAGGLGRSLKTTCCLLPCRFGSAQRCFCI